MSHYDQSKQAVQTLIQQERTDRYSKKLNRTPNTPSVVRELYATGLVTQKYLAQRQGCTASAISQCVTYKTYRNV